MQPSPPPSASAETAPRSGGPSKRLLLALIVAAALVLAGVSVYVVYLRAPTAPPNTPPSVLGIQVSPSTGNDATPFNFTAAVSDAQDPASAIQVRWDWQNDGVWDTSWSTDKAATHVFAQPGNYTVSVQARDTGNLTGFATEPVDVHRSTLTYYEMFEPSSMDPSDAYDLWSFVPLQNTYETLVGFDRDKTQIVPELATSWDVSASGLNWTFHLRQGVRFCDGATLTASDVAASFEKVLIENSPNTGVAWILNQTLDTNDLPGSIWVKDAYTIQFNETAPALGGKPYVAFLATLTTAEPAAIMEGAWIQAHGGVAPGTPNLYIMENTMGTGPYCMSSSDWVHGSQMTLHRNPYYWRGWTGSEPWTIAIKFTTDLTARIAALQSRAADIADLPLPYVSQAGSIPGVVAKGNATVRSEFVAMNTRNPYLADNATGRLVRRALSYAFDYNLTIASIFDGYASLLPGPIPAGVPYSDVEHQVYYQDLQRAGQLLDQAGYPGNATNPRFGGYSFAIVVDGTQIEERNAAQLFAYTLGLLGIRTVLQVTATTAAWDVARSSGSYDLLFGSWILDYLDPDDFVSPMVVSAANGGDYWNTAFSNGTIDLYAVQARSETNTAVRAADYGAVAAMALANPNLIWYCQPQFIPVHQASLQDFWFNPVTWYNFYFYGLP